MKKTSTGKEHGWPGGGDYVSKRNRHKDIVPAVKQALKEAEDMSGLAEGKVACPLALLPKLRGFEETYLHKNLERILSVSSEAISIFDERLRIVWANRAMEQLVGLNNEKIHGNHCCLLFGRDAADVEVCPMSRMLASGRREISEFELLDKALWVRITAEPFQIEGWELVGRIVVISDITLRKRAEMQVLRREREIRSLVENLPDIITRFDRDLRHTCVSSAMKQVTGLRPDLFPGKTNRDPKIPADLYDRWEPAIRQVFETGEDNCTEFEFHGPDGPRHHESRLMKEFGEDGSVESVLCITRDVTEWKKMEKSIRDYQEKLHELTERTQSKIELERKRISREIHDCLGSEVFGLKIGISLLKTGLRDDHQESMEKADVLLTEIDGIIRMLRRICEEIRPDMIDDLGVAVAIESEIARFQHRTGIECEFVHHSEQDVLDNDISLVIFRVLQEALTNIARHAEATRVVVRLLQNHTGTELSVEDNGRGITQKDVSRPDSLGLMGIRERVAIRNGTVTIQGTLGMGTKLAVFIPF